MPCGLKAPALPRASRKRLWTAEPCNRPYHVLRICYDKRAATSRFFNVRERRRSRRPYIFSMFQGRVFPSVLDQACKSLSGPLLKGVPNPCLPLRLWSERVGPEATRNMLSWTCFRQGLFLGVVGPRG
jgi:hypothetical protein